MNKKQFIRKLNRRLARLPKADRLRFTEYYSEMIDDRMEEGMDEPAAVAAMGSPNAVIGTTLSEAGQKRIPWRPVLTACALPLLIVLWSCVIALLSAWLGITVCAPGSLLLTAAYAARGQILQSVGFIGAGCVCAGAALLLFRPCIAMIRYSAVFSRFLIKGRRKKA